MLLHSWNSKWWEMKKGSGSQCCHKIHYHCHCKWVILKSSSVIPSAQQSFVWLYTIYHSGWCDFCANHIFRSSWNIQYLLPCSLNQWHINQFWDSCSFHWHRWDLLYWYSYHSTYIGSEQIICLIALAGQNNSNNLIFTKSARIFEGTCCINYMAYACIKYFQ